MLEKLKSLVVDDSLYFALLLVLVGVVSFGLGQRSGVESRPPVSPAAAGVIFTEVSAQPVEVSINTQSVVASRSGTKYHLASCPGATQIKAENKLWFDSIELAEAAGYTPAANCPDLQ